MEQCATSPLFANCKEEWPLPGAMVSYEAGFLGSAEADALLVALLEQIDWQQWPITLFGKQMLQPRLTAWHGDPGIGYGYSGMNFIASGWTPALDELRQRLERGTSAKFNAVLCNRYRDGQDSMGWHSDDEPALGQQPVIASVSLGAERVFRFRAKRDHSQLFNTNLQHGSLLIMAGETQSGWQHALPKTKRDCGERINLTFRLIQSGD